MRRRKCWRSSGRKRRSWKQGTGVRPRIRDPETRGMRCGESVGAAAGGRGGAEAMRSFPAADTRPKQRGYLRRRDGLHFRHQQAIPGTQLHY